LEGFGEVVGHVDGGVNPIEEDEVLFNPFTQGEVFYVNVLGPRGWFLSVSHGGTSIIIFVENGGGFLGNVEIPKYAPDKKYHLTRVVGCHKFCLSRGTGDRRLEFAFICNRAASEAKAYATERTTCFDTCGPV
jgi:hypothetical protein